MLGRELKAAASGQAVQTVLPARSISKWWIVVPVAVFGLVALLITVIALNFVAGRMRASRDAAVNINAAAPQPVNPSPAPVQASPSIDAPANLKGTWAGTYGPAGNVTKLIIKNQKDNELDGVLEQGATRVAFKGTFDPRSRAVRLSQTEVLSGEDWSLGEDVGTLSADGKKLSGTGKDAIGGAMGISYNWTFERVTDRH